MRWFNFILSHSVFVAFCAGALVYQSYILMGKPLKPEVFGLVFFSTLAAYNAYWILCKLNNDRKNRTALQFNTFSGYFILFIAGSIAVLDYLWQMPVFFPIIIVTSILTFSYILPVISSLKFRLRQNTGIIKTFLLAFTWSFFTVIVPAFDDSEITSVNWPHVLSVLLSRFFFMLMLCIIFDSRDVSVDKLNDLPSIGSGFDRKHLTIIMMVVLVFYVLSLFWLDSFINNATVLFLLLLTGALTLVMYLLALKKRGYYFYYFLTDGIMLLSSLSVYLATI